MEACWNEVRACVGRCPVTVHRPMCPTTAASSSLRLPSATPLRNPRPSHLKRRRGRTMRSRRADGGCLRSGVHTALLHVRLHLPHSPRASPNTCKRYATSRFYMAIPDLRNSLARHARRARAGGYSQRCAAREGIQMAVTERAVTVSSSRTATTARDTWDRRDNCDGERVLGSCMLYQNGRGARWGLGHSRVDGRRRRCVIFAPAQPCNLTDEPGSRVMKPHSWRASEGKSRIGWP
ncbi:hypothetical protein B0H14DRAFT_919322 [Mycena olivaceomarginata]|nr:hypothetical protein B0H14DRAFT_919322 [Mycena olivaceomarginata]